MNRYAAAIHLLLCPTIAGSALSQTVTDASATILNYSIDSVGNGNDDWFISADPSAGPVVYDMFVEIEEPIRHPFAPPSFHRASNQGQVETIGDVWTGFASYSVEYPDTLDLGTNIGDPNIVSGSVAMTFVNVSFTLDEPTAVELEAAFRTDLNQPFDPIILDGFSASINNNGSALLTTGFDYLASGVDQSFSGSVLLQPGDYEFRAAGQLAALEEFGYRSASASFDYSLTFVPAPASAGLLLGAGLLAHRRRTV
ncbi:MAG: hypothetical protein ACIARQ_11775 [Phycisphaerales bacterium JB061]